MIGTRIASSGATGMSGIVSTSAITNAIDEHAADEDRVDRERAGPVAGLAFEVQAAARAVGDHREPVPEQVPAAAARAPAGDAPPQHPRARGLHRSRYRRCRAQSRCAVLVVPSLVMRDRAAFVRLGRERVRAGRRRGCWPARGGRRRSARSRCRATGVPSRSNATDVASSVTSPSTSPAGSRRGRASTLAWLVAGSTRRKPLRGRRRRPDAALACFVMYQPSAVVHPKLVGIGAQHLDHARDRVRRVVVDRTAREAEPAGDGERARIVVGDAERAHRDLHRRREARVEIEVGDVVERDARPRRARRRPRSRCRASRRATTAR